MKIEEQIITKTTHCEKNFDCLKSDKHHCCKVKYCVNKEVHFINCANNINCSYKMIFGNSFICICPVRKEIYNKNGV